MLRAVALLVLWMGLLSTRPLSGVSLQEAQDVPSTASDTGLQEPPAPIGEVRRDEDGDGVPDRLGDTVRVAGRATVGAAVLDRDRTRLFIQDGSGGILLFSSDPDPGVEAGDSVVATGVVGQFRGLTEIELNDLRTVPGPGRLPDPVEIPLAAADFEALEGTLVRVRAVVKGAGSHQWGDFRRMGAADAPEALFTIYAARSHDDTPGLDRFDVGDEVEVTGILGQHDFEPPYDADYELYPRSAGDLAAVGFSRRLLRNGLLAAAALLGVAGLGLVVLRAQVRRRTHDLAASERLARDSREHLSLLLAHAPVVLWTVDRDFRITWAEGRVLNELGSEPQELVGRSLTDIFGTDDFEAEPLAAYRRCLEGEPAEFELELDERVWEVRLRPVREGGRTTGVVGAALDATHHREVELRLAEQSAYFQKLFEEAPEAIVLVDGDDRVLQVNPEFERMFGYRSGEAVGQTVNDLIAPPGQEAEAKELTRRVASGERVEVEAVRRHRDGTLVDVSILATRIEVGHQRRVYGIYRDITEQKTFESQLLHSQRLEAVGQLAGGVAHDFNNILTAILGHTRVLLEDRPEDPHREDVEQIEAAAERAARLTRQLLTFSRRDMASPRSVDLNSIIRETRSFLVRLIEEHVELGLELARELPPVEADPSRLEQVVVNLVINARDAMPDGGRVTLTTRSVDGDAPDPIESSGPGDWVMLEVRDTGHGMGPEERTRMFEPFFTTKPPGEGTGLGLSTVYGIVEQADGFIHVDSALETGTAVRIYLPALNAMERPPGERVALDAGAADERLRPGSGETVLLVDDDRPVRDVARRILERAGYRVLAVGSGADALALTDREGVVPDAVVTDIVMPGMNGYELARRLRERYPGVRVLLMTGYTDATPADQRVHSEILRKPFDAMTLVRRLREQMAADEDTPRASASRPDAGR